MQRLNHCLLPSVYEFTLVETYFLFDLYLPFQAKLILIGMYKICKLNMFSFDYNLHFVLKITCRPLVL